MGQWEFHHFKACDIWKVLLGVLIGLFLASVAFGIAHRGGCIW
ncbi:MAG TPA: hypothetical protein VNK24_12000 [Elusimicrobiota bacterium]|nr:hypothetical protein [Elusimicrobiota bacterium]